MGRFISILALVVLLFGLSVPAARACATCYGASDSPMAQGMNMGILTLLVVVATVLFGIVTFFIYVARKAAKMAAAASVRNQTN